MSDMLIWNTADKLRLRENEQEALEMLKKQVHDPSDVLSSWVVGKDCCEWEGVVCHNLTRHVTELQIYGMPQYGSKGLRIDSFRWLPSLSNLEILGMDGVDFNKATDWLQVINMLPSLFELSLPNCDLHHIPPIQHDHHNFSSLETLNLYGNNFGSSIPKWIFNLPNLVSLDLADSNFIGSFPQGPYNLTSLRKFRASSNSFNSLLPKWLFDLSNLELVDLSQSRIEGAIPDKPGNMTKLKYLLLPVNNLSSTIPTWLYGCENLEELILGGNMLEGQVSELISNLSSIATIGLDGNQLSGKIPGAIGKSSKLKGLYLSDNLFVGDASELFQGLSGSTLMSLTLNNNELTGNLPKSLSSLSMLQDFDISNNKLKGVVTESHFTNLTKLMSFCASGNRLTLKVSQNWIPSFQALEIKIGGWNIGPEFPMWLKTQKQIIQLDISDGGIQGEVPTWFWNLSSQTEYLNLSRNQFVGEVSIMSAPSLEGVQFWCLSNNNFSGTLPQISTTLSELDLSNNSFSGGLSHFFCKAKNESYKLEILNLRGNDLSKEIPDCWMNWLELRVLILSDNKLIGGIPRSMEVLSQLQSLDFRRNSLTGPLPSSLGNCTNLVKIDLAENEFVGKLPSWLGIKLSKLIILSLRSNKFHGELGPELCNLQDLQILDLANNGFTGSIPRCVSNFTGMVTGKKLIENKLRLDYGSYSGVLKESAMVTTKGNMYQYDKILALFTSMDVSSNNLSGNIPAGLTSLVGLRSLNFSKNHLSATIPNGIGNMKVLESVDLSQNQLSGQIPQSFSSLSTLSYLNLSYNDLSGKIPVSTQLQSFSPSSFHGNKLCGLPLLVNCSSGGGKIPDVDTEEDDEDEVDWFYISMAIGFSLTFWGIAASLIFNTSWRHAYFGFIDRKWESLYTFFHSV